MVSEKKGDVKAPTTVNEVSKDEDAVPPPLPVKTGIKEEKKPVEATKLDEPPKPPVRTKGSRASESNSSKEETQSTQEPPSRHLISHQDSVRQQPTGIVGFFKSLFSCASAKK